MIACAVCGGELRPPLDQHYARVEGWEKPGRGLGGKSGSSLVLRQRTGALAHTVCIVGISQGVTPDQMTFEDVGLRVTRVEP